MSSEPMDIPVFINESEEADWWFEHQDLLLTQFKKAAAEGRLGRGIAAQRAREMSSQIESSAVTIRLEPADEAKARAIAAKRGIAYEIYLGQLLHQELQKPVDALDSASAA